MSKIILYQEDARRALEKGMDILAEAVSVTLGPYESPWPRTTPKSCGQGMQQKSCQTGICWP